MVLADAGPWKKIRGCSCDGLCFSEVSIRLVQGLLREENNVSVVPNVSLKYKVTKPEEDWLLLFKVRRTF